MVIIDFSIVYHLNLITVPKFNILAGLWVNRMLKQGLMCLIEQKW